MTNDVWREVFDSCAPLYMNEVYTADSGREAAPFEMEIMAFMRRRSA